MPLYRYECEGCGKQLIEDCDVELRNAPRVHEGCGVFARVFGFSFHRAMPEHHNTSLGLPVRNEAHAMSELHRASDEMSARMGFDVNYEFVDPSQPAELGVTDAGLEDTERAHYDATNDGHKDIFT